MNYSHLHDRPCFTLIAHTSLLSFSPYIKHLHEHCTAPLPCMTSLLPTCLCTYSQAALIPSPYRHLDCHNPQLPIFHVLAHLTSSFEKSIG